MKMLRQCITDKRTFSVSSTPTAIQPQQFTHLRVLVAEDNKVNQKVIQGMLKRFGIIPIMADNGQQALDIIIDKHQNFDIVFMDCEMPVMDGYEASRQIRHFEQQNELAAITIVALTAHAVHEFLQRCYDCGMNDHVLKPIEISRLEAVLSALP